MHQFFRYVLASALGTILASAFMLFMSVMAVIFIVFISSKFSGDKKLNFSSNEKKQVLYIDLGQEIKDNTDSYDDFESLFESPDKHKIGLSSLTQTIEDASSDDSISGILVRYDGASLGFSNAQSLKSAFEKFRSHKKFIYSFAEEYDEKSYYIALSTDKIFLHEKGFFEWNGFAATLSFFKKTIGKLKAQVEVFRVGKFKSAVEPFLAEKMSEESKDQLNTILQDFWEMVIDEVVKVKKIERAELESWANNMTLRRALDAKDKGLVDELTDIQSLYKKIGKELGWKDNKTKFASWRDYFKSNEDLKISDDDNQIGLLFAEGDIVDGFGERGQVSSREVVRQLRKMDEDKNIKSIVIRVNSGGGSALASDVMWKATQVIKKPIVVSFGNYAASGGYYMSAGADWIIAEPGTITGSIGVFGLHFITKQTFDEWLGVTFDQTGTHELSDLPSSARELKPRERVILQENVENIYQDFLKVVQSGRTKFKSVDEVHEIAQGRVWTGLRAFKMGLVDQLGSLDDAILKAKNLGKIKGDDYSVVTYPQKESFWESFFSFASGTKLFSSLVSQILGINDSFFENQKMSDFTLAQFPYKLKIK